MARVKTRQSGWSHAHVVATRVTQHGRCQLAVMSDYSERLSSRHPVVTSVSRGVARARATGKLELLVSDYPYAEDALPLWEALQRYVHDTSVRLTCSRRP